MNKYQLLVAISMLLSVTYVTDTVIATTTKSLAKISENLPTKVNSSVILAYEQPETIIPQIVINDNKFLEQQAQQLYENGQYQQAISLLETAIINYQNSGEITSQPTALRNLALLHQRLGAFPAAETALNQSRNLLKNIPNLQQKNLILAQILEVETQLQLSRGNSQQALETAQKSADIYQQLNDTTGWLKSKINQVQALQSAGLYSLALKTLIEIQDTLTQQPNSKIKAKSLQTLGDILRGVGKLEESEDALQESLNLNQQIASKQAIAETLLSLGKTARLQQQPQKALDYYQKVITISPTPDLVIQAQLNQLELLLENQPKQLEQITLLIKNIFQNLEQLTSNRAAIYARLTLAKIALKYEDNSLINNYKTKIVRELSIALTLSQKLGDQRAEAYSLGILGSLYEQNKRNLEAQQLTEQAITISQSINASDLAYQWQWQLGRLQQKQANPKAAIAAYSQSVNTLKSIRGDLVAISSEIQYSFRESVEPVYRELVSLLLQPGANQENLQQAREVIESLQLAELDNFFRDACLNAKPVQIDQLDPTAAIFYPIILPDRLEIIVALPGQPLRNYRTSLTQAEIETTLDELRATLAEKRERFFQKKRLKLSETVYSWLINPIETELKQANLKNLIFIPDGAFRNIPMAALYDGEKYLIQNYAVAFAPSLQLIDPKTLVREKIELISGGLSEARQGFPALPNAELELERIHAELPNSYLLFNQTFTENNLKTEVTKKPVQVIHFATHGQFSSEAENTFILTWDEKIDINDLNTFLRADPRQTKPIELLVLSACKTAAGDNRAALGLAGIAVRAGARSTLASLWSVSDPATSVLMTRFYQELTNSNIPKAEALRRAQLSLLESKEYAHPYYWSAFVLLGNWF